MRGRARFQARGDLGLTLGSNHGRDHAQLPGAQPRTCLLTQYTPAAYSKHARSGASKHGGPQGAPGGQGIQLGDQDRSYGWRQQTAALGRGAGPRVPRPAWGWAVGTWGALGCHTLGAGADRASVQVTPGTGPRGHWRRRARKGNSPSADHRHKRTNRRQAGPALRTETCHPEAAPPGRGLASEPREGRARLTLVGAACSQCGPSSPKEPDLQGSPVRLGEPSAWPPGPWLLAAACGRSCCPEGPGSGASITAQLPYPTVLLLTHEDIPSPMLLVWFSQRVPFPQEKRLPTTYPE